MISYADLERVYRTEKDSPLMQSIPEKFYSDAMELAGAPEFKDQSVKVFELINEIYDRRRTKIILQALRTMKDKPPDNATSKEAESYKNIVALLKESRDSILQPAKQQEKEIDVAKIKVRMLRPMPSITASDLKEYGPFNGNEVVELPEDNARIFITQGIAEEVKTAFS